jgi:nucleoid DNA-binding protein
MQKPSNMSVKDYIITQVAEDLKQPQDLVEKVIAFQGEDLLWAFKNSKNIEISGFGKFTMSPHKVKRVITNYSKTIEELETKEDEPSQAKKERMTKIVEFLNTKYE